MRYLRSRSAPSVEWNITAMLDLAFQLLAFFVLTFRPSPAEPQISLRLPPPLAVRPASVEPPGPVDLPAAGPAGVETLRLGVGKTAGGALDYAVGEQRVSSLTALEARLRQVFADPRQPFRQVVLEIDGEVAYEQVLAVVERCTRQRLPGGARLERLSLVEKSPVARQGTL
jgi:biopolymer transport protein ExbD